MDHCLKVISLDKETDGRWGQTGQRTGASLTLKVIIARYVFIAILNLAFQLVLYFFFVPFLSVFPFVV